MPPEWVLNTGANMRNICISNGTAPVKYLEQAMLIKISENEAEYVARHVRHTC